MDICSPKNGFVLKIYVKVKDLVSVSPAMPFLDMDTEAEDKALAHLDLMDATRAANAAQYTGDQLQLLQDLAKAAVDLATAKQTPFPRALVEAKDQQKQYYNTLQYLNILSSSNIADQELKRALAQQSQLDFSVKRHAALDAAAATYSQAHRKYLTDFKQRLSIKAPIAGKVTRILVAEGSFAKRGSVLATVEG